jgi:UDP-N-acetyl-D-mannosaminuronic acid transferase (WecB/TagA/CpsF family)
MLRAVAKENEHHKTFHAARLERALKQPETPLGENQMTDRALERRILGVDFYTGDVDGAVARMATGGLLVVPSAPSLKDIASIEDYREALLKADMAITDSALMVMIWNFLERDSIPRLSGLKYLRALMECEDVRQPGETFYVMAGQASADKNLNWLASEGITVPPECVYIAPLYGDKIEDKELLRRLEERRPRHVILTVGGGTQERVGLYIKENLDYLPAIHCIGAAIAFLSGDQVYIPAWADRLYLGWLFRCISSPRRYVPRYFAAPQLIPLMWRYRDQLPVAGDSRSALTQME